MSSSSSFDPFSSDIDREYDCKENFSVDVTEYNGTCRAGYVCNATHESSCDDIRDVAIDKFKFGGIHDGLYCPENSTFLQQCPQSFYCPNSSTRIICPKGKYCASKTREPYIDCWNCQEGAMKLHMSTAFLVSILVIVGVLGLVYIGYTLFQEYVKDAMAKLEAISSRTLNATDIERHSRQQQEQLNRLLSKFEIINRRLRFNVKEGDDEKKIDEALTITSSSSSSKVSFDENKFFRLIDVDENGSVSYDELNAVMQLKDSEMKEFISQMNHAAAVVDDETSTNTEVSIDVFVDNFLDTLEECTSFQLLPEEAGIRWDEMAQKKEATTKDGKRMIKLNQIYDSSISDFLTDKQIRTIITNFNDILVEEEVHLSRNTEVIDVRGVRGMLVSRDVFCKHYPKVLNKVLEDKMNSNMGTIRSVSGIDIAFRNLQLAVKAGQNVSVNVVDNVTGRIQGGAMTALMGGSGAGKTSLLCALCGKAYYGEVKGDVFINGKLASIQDIASNVGFVPQDDIVYAELTVRENFLFSGKFRLPKKTPNHEIDSLAEDVMASLGLARKANSLVGDVTRRGLSGGEKKRVNIGLEMMAKPSALFLDEPTSGLDASSALLVMKSLKDLTNLSVGSGTGVTVCSVIHQPRKYIFDLHNSIILLGVGGRMVYHGAVDKAESYFTSLGYKLKSGDSLADWMIDISTGRIGPDVDAFTADEKNNALMVSKIGQSDFNVKANTNAKSQSADDEAKLRCQLLYKSWNLHFKGLTGEQRLMYDPPPESALPPNVVVPSFHVQFVLQLKRLCLLFWRNRTTKILETLILVGVVCIFSFLKRPNDLEMDSLPPIPYERLITGSKCQERFVSAFFEGPIDAAYNYILYGLAVGILTSIVVSISAAKTLTEKRLEFYREAGSGYDINAYFWAINIYTTIEQGLQVIFASILAYYIWGAISAEGIFIFNFLLIMWISVSWSLFIALVAPPSVTMLSVVFFVIFTCFVLTPPNVITFDDIYDNNFLSVICAFFSPTRLFIETMVVSDFKCLRSQTGYTVDDDAVNFPEGKDSFTLAGLGMNDLSVTKMSCSGWYWNILPALMVGLTVRFAAFGVINTFNRSKQAKTPFLEELQKEKGCNKLLQLTGLYVFILLGLIVFTCWTILRKG